MNRLPEKEIYFFVSTMILLTSTLGGMELSILSGAKSHIQHMLGALGSLPGAGAVLHHGPRGSSSLPIGFLG